MQFDTTITLGNVLNIILMFVTVGISAWRLSMQLRKLQWKMKLIWRWYAKSHKIEDDDNEEI